MHERREKWEMGKRASFLKLKHVVSNSGRPPLFAAAMLRRVASRGEHTESGRHTGTARRHAGTARSARPSHPVSPRIPSSCLKLVLRSALTSLSLEPAFSVAEGALALSLSSGAGLGLRKRLWNGLPVEVVMVAGVVGVVRLRVYVPVAAAVLPALAEAAESSVVEDDRLEWSGGRPSLPLEAPV